MNLDKPQAEEVQKIIETHGGIKYVEEEKVQTQTGQDKSGDSPNATGKISINRTCPGVKGVKI